MCNALKRAHHKRAHHKIRWNTGPAQVKKLPFQRSCAVYTQYNGSSFLPAVSMVASIVVYLTRPPQSNVMPVSAVFVPKCACQNALNIWVKDNRTRIKCKIDQFVT